MSNYEEDLARAQARNALIGLISCGTTIGSLVIVGLIFWIAQVGQ